MSGTIWPFGSKEPCPCPRTCKWFRCGQPGPQEHVFKCEVFNATAGNYSSNPAALEALKERIAHVLGCTDDPPHDFGICGTNWTIAALNYRLRDGPMASSFALLLCPRPVPRLLNPSVMKLAGSKKPYQPRSHRLFDTNPFNGLGIGRSGVEKKELLSHLARAIWSEHANWTARQLLSMHVDWSKWRYAHVAGTPAQLTTTRSSSLSPPSRPLRTSRSFNSAMDKERPSPQLNQRAVVNPASRPLPSPGSSLSQISTTPGTPTPTTPVLHHPRPQSFGGFARWDIPQHETASRPKGPSRRPRAPIPKSYSVPLQLEESVEVEATRVLAASKRNSLVMLESNGSTYYLVNDTVDASFAVSDHLDHIEDSIPNRRLTLAV